jgi:hypothetical protein
MTIRKLPASHGLAWVRNSLDLGARNPKAVFGAALLLMVVFYLLALGLALVGGALAGAAENAGAAFLAIFMPLTLGMMVLLPILLGGLMHVIREVEAGRPARATDLFAPLRSARFKSLVGLGLVQVAFALLGIGLMVAIAGADYWKDYMAFMASVANGTTPTALPAPENGFVLFVWQLVYNYFSYAIMLFAVPLVLFSGKDVLGAVREAARASTRNVAPNLLAAVVFVGGTIVAAIVVILLAGLLNLLGGLVHPALGNALAFMVFLAFSAGLLVLLAGGAYIAWRDTFDAPTDAPPPAFTGIEA